VTTKEKFVAMAEDAAAHSTTMAKGHRAAEKCFKARGADFSDAAEAHGTMADACEKDAENHMANCKALKAAIAADLAKLRPDSISSVAGSDAPAEAFGIRAVPRPGAPDRGAFDKAAVPAEFRHLLGTSEES
jgi:hypothetical protein